jgi:hypothetical protein
LVQLVALFKFEKKATDRRIACASPEARKYASTWPLGMKCSDLGRCFVMASMSCTEVKTVNTRKMEERSQPKRRAVGEVDHFAPNQAAFGNAGRLDLCQQSRSESLSGLAYLQVESLILDAAGLGCVDDDLALQLRRW